MIDRSVTEIASTRPVLRREVRIACRNQRGAVVYLLEDPLTGKFFEIGPREHALISLLDGSRTLSEIVALTVSGPRASGLNEGEATSLIRTLSDAGLLQSSSDDQARRIREHKNEKRDLDRASQKAKGLFFLRIPVGNPDRFLARVNQVFGPVPDWIFGVLWLAVILWGLSTFASHSSRFMEEMQGVLKVGNLAIFGGVWLLLKAVHEFCHGIVCKRFGGSVPEAGVSLLLFVTPLAYVDASSSIRFASKWHRILVAAAGILGEFLVASLALVAWAALEPGVLGSVLHQVVVISTVTTVLFNANPLMKFDGYYIASDLLGISNLYTKGQQSSRYFWKRWLLGIKGISSPLRGLEKRDQFLIFSYGLASAVWRIIVTVGIFIAACVLFQGAGKILAILVAVATIAGGVRSLVKYVRKSAALEKANLFWIGLRLGAFAALVYLAAGLIEVSPSVKAPAILDPGRVGEIRVECPGFVEKLHVKNGDQVEAGAPILSLRNREMEAELARLEREFLQSKLRADLYLKDENMAGFQAEQENISGLESKLKDLRRYVETLEIKAPLSGHVYARELASREGDFLEKGSIAVRIVNVDNRELRVSIPQDRLEAIGKIEPGDEVEVFDQDTGRHLRATLERIRPQADTEVIHPGLTSIGGGPLLVRDSYDGGDPILVTPHFTAIATMEGEHGLREGELLWARFSAGESVSLKAWTGRRVQQWFSNRL